MATTPSTERSVPTLTPLPILPSRLAGTVGPPVPLTALVGRQGELALARELLHRPDLRLLTLTGPGGIGKTRLALQLAADLADTFADGVRFVPLESVRDAGLVAASIAHAVGVQPIGGAPMHDALTSALHAADILLVVDNFEHVLAAASVLTELLASCPRLKILATSRVLLRVAGEHALAVPPLTLPDPRSSLSLEDLVRSSAIQLFTERAQAVDVSFALSATNAPRVAEICRRLDGLPLAIELVAPRVRHLALPDLLDRLGRRLPLLTGGARDKPSRLQTMRNAIAWSHDLLTPEEQTLFRRLAVFTGGFLLEAAEYVGGEAGRREGGDDPGLAFSPSRLLASSVFDGLATLIDASLLQTDIPSDGAVRYRMLETIREYALERLAESGEPREIRRRHAAFFLAFAERYELAELLPDGEQILALLDAEHANLRAALAWLEEADESELFLRLAAALGRFWYSQGHYHDGRGWLERALEHGGAAAAGTLRVRAQALVLLGIIETYLGANRDAEIRLTEGLAACRDVDDALHAAYALIFLGGLVAMQGDRVRAAALLEETLGTAQVVPDQRLAGILTGLALINLAVADRTQGNRALAAARIEDALRLVRDAGYTAGTILALSDLGDLALDEGDHAQALGFYREALGLVRGNPGTRLVTEVVEAVGIVAAVAGQAERGARLLGAAEALRERIGLRFRVAENEVALEQALVAARAALGEEAFTAALAAGRNLRPEEAVAEALAAEGEEARRREGEHGPALSPSRHPALTPREAEILHLLAAGQTDPAIAATLFISVRTVENHVAHIFAKLGVQTRTAAVSAAVAAGLIVPASSPRA